MTVRDFEVLDLLHNKPQLLAIADAVGATQARKARLPKQLIAVPAIAVVLIAAALFAPWQNSTPSLLDRALAAVGEGPVLHVVTEQTQPVYWHLVDLATGERSAPALSVKTEIWYDGERGLEHSVSRTNGKVSGEVLQTPDGVTSEEGTVYTCAWIQAHPVEATRKRISCRFDGNNGTTPHKVPEPPPVIDPGLSGFLNGYQDALANGSARKVGEGTIDGRSVIWLEMHLALPRPPGADRPLDPIEQKVAIDSETYRPIVVQPLNGGVAYKVAEIGSVSRESADFSKPEPVPATQLVAGGSVTKETEIGLSDASNVLGAPALWAGPEVAGLKLTKVTHQVLSAHYARETGLPPNEAQALELVYGKGRPGSFLATRGGRPGEDSLTISEATEVPFALGWPSREPLWELPPPGFVRIGPFDWGYLRRDGLYLKIVSTLGEDAVIAAARALEPIP